jgi:hypothetical protein
LWLVIHETTPRPRRDHCQVDKVEVSEVTYTVKEILGQMELRADERHRELVRRIDAGVHSVDTLAGRVDKLEQWKDQAEGGKVSRKAVLAIATFIVTLVGVVASLPIAAFYFRGG